MPLLTPPLTSLFSAGSTDFGNVTFIVPGIHPYFYIGCNALNHTEEYTVAAGMSFNDILNVSEHRTQNPAG